MAFSLIQIGIVVMAITGSESGNIAVTKSSGNPGGGTGTNPTGVTADLEPPSGTKMTFFDRFGLTRRANKPLEPINIPASLDGHKENIVKYNQALYNQRVALHNRMTRHMTYYMMVMVMLKFYGSSSFAQGLAFVLIWLNSNWRHTINADWVIHQRQLGEYLVEYARVNNLDLGKVPKSRLYGTGVVRLYLDEKKKRSVRFPVMITQKGEPLPPKAEVRKTYALVRNWLLR